MFDWYTRGNGEYQETLVEDVNGRVQRATWYTRAGSLWITDYPGTHEVNIMIHGNRAAAEHYLTQDGCKPFLK